MKNRNIIFAAILSGLVCIALLPQVQATPDPGSVGPFNTADGDHALFTNTTGAANAAFGWYALFGNLDGSFNTAVGAGALDLNNGSSNTAVGAAALLLNTTGNQNTAVGTAALELNTDGVNNTANGAFALFSNTGGDNNTAVGLNALFTNTTGNGNVAVGGAALGANDDGTGNVAVGLLAVSANIHGLFNTGLGFAAVQNNSNSNNTGVGAGAIGLNTIGADNTAVGFNALHSGVIGGGNTAVGSGALENALTGFNTALGNDAGSAVVNAHNVISIGIAGDDVSDSCFIGNIRGVTTDLNDAQAVLIDSLGQLGTISSSRRFKTDIKPMDEASASILAFKPVSFRYKVHRGGPAQFGLIAEDVAEVNRDLVIYDSDGKPQTVRYEAVNAMLLNEFLKEHQTVQELKTTVAQQKKQIDALTAGLEKVSAQLEVRKPATQVAVSNK